MQHHGGGRNLAHQIAKIHQIPLPQLSRGGGKGVRSHFVLLEAFADELHDGRFFLAGVVPGVLLTLAMRTAIYLVARRRNLPRQPKASFIQVVRSGRDALWGLLLIVIISGGIYGGIFTPTEAAAGSVVYAV